MVHMIGAVSEEMDNDHSKHRHSQKKHRYDEGDDRSSYENEENAKRTRHHKHHSRSKEEERNTFESRKSRRGHGRSRDDGAEEMKDASRKGSDDESSARSGVVDKRRRRDSFSRKGVEDKSSISFHSKHRNRSNSQDMGRLPEEGYGNMASSSGRSELQIKSERKENSESENLSHSELGRWGKRSSMTNKDTKALAEKEKPNFVPSGKLAEDTNTFRGVVIKYNEPNDARKPKLRWRLYPFKGDEALPILYIHRQSAYLIGRDRKIADLPVDHPSCSKQHAVLQYRSVPVDLPDGTTVRRIRPYIIDLGSANGTYLNGERLESQRFVELKEKDVIKFGFSSREFVLLNEKSDEGGAMDIEAKVKESPPSD